MNATGFLEKIMNESSLARFWMNVQKALGETACWDWLGGLDDQGRGRFRLAGQAMIASRAAYLIQVGPIPPEKPFVLHTCDRPRCVRGDHLVAGTHEDNMADMAAKGRSPVYLHPEAYRRRARKATSRFRPVKQPGAGGSGIDPRTWTCHATASDRMLARLALDQLEAERNRITLVPAPAPHFAGHKVRIQEAANPAWYRSFSKPYWTGDRQFNLKRSRVERALRRVLAGRVRGNGYEQELLIFLRGFFHVPEDDDR